MARIILDVDSTIADLLTPWISSYNAAWADTLVIADIESWSLHKHVKPECGADGLYKIIKEPGFFLALEPFAGAVDIIQRWARNHEVLFVTDVLTGASHIYGEKTEWLGRHFGKMFTPDKLIFAGVNRGLLRADLLIDDKPANLLEFKKHNPDAQTWAIAYPYNEEVAQAVDLRAYGFQEPEAAWQEFAAASDSIGAAPDGKLCFAPLPDGSLCKAKGCEVHKRLTIPGSTYYPKAVWEALGDMAANSRLETMDAELAYLRTIPDRIERDFNRLRPADAYGLLIHSIREVMAATERMANYQANQQLMVHRDAIKGLLVDIGAILKRYVVDQAVLDKIGKDIMRLDMRVNTKVKALRSGK